MTAANRAAHPDFTIPHIPTFRAKVFHPCQGEFSQIAIFDTGRNKRHGDITELLVRTRCKLFSLPLYTVHPGPWRHESHYSGNDIDQSVGRVILVLARAP